MRRLPALLTCVAVLWVGLLLAMAQFIHHPGAVFRGLGSAARMVALPGAALAQQTMEFKPVPPESAGKFDRRRTVRHAEPATPPPVPEPPESPTPPAPEHGGSDMMRIGSDVTVSAEEVIHGDVATVGGDITVEGHVEGDVAATGGDVYLKTGSKVDGDVVCVGGKLHEEPGAWVGGKRVTLAGPGGAKFKPWMFPMFGVLGSGIKAATDLLTLLILLGIAWLIAKIAPVRSAAALETLKREPGMSFALGLLVWALLIPSVIALALVIALLCITIIGIPLAAAVAVAYSVGLVVLALWGYIVGGAAIGERLVRQLRGTQASLSHSAMWGVGLIGLMFAVGHMLGMVPLFGIIGGLLIAVAWLVKVAAGTFGMGALLRSELGSGAYRRWWPARFSPNRGAAAGAGVGAPVAPAAQTGFAPPAAPPSGPPSTGYEPPTPPVS